MDYSSLAVFAISRTATCVAKGKNSNWSKIQFDGRLDHMSFIWLAILIKWEQLCRQKTCVLQI